MDFGAPEFEAAAGLGVVIMLVVAAWRLSRRKPRRPRLAFAEPPAAPSHPRRDAFKASVAAAFGDVFRAHGFQPVEEIAHDDDLYTALFFQSPELKLCLYASVRDGEENAMVALPGAANARTSLLDGRRYLGETGWLSLSGVARRLDPPSGAGESLERLAAIMRGRYAEVVKAVATLSV